jgi:group I intron endonuclease
MIVSGIYKIFDNKNRVYIGSSVNIYKRLTEHIRNLSKGNHQNIFLQRFFNKNKENLFYSIVEFIPQKNLLLKREQYWIDFYNSYNIGYNMCPKAENTLGRFPSKESKRKMSLSHKGKRNGMYGKTHTKQVKDKLSQLVKERLVTNEFRNKMSIVTKGKNNGMFGKTHTEESKLKMSVIKKKLGCHKGKNNGMFGKTHTEEVLTKIKDKIKCQRNGLNKEFNPNYGNYKIPKKLWRNIYRKYIKKERVSDLAKKYSVNYQTIYNIINFIKKNDEKNKN